MYWYLEDRPAVTALASTPAGAGWYLQPLSSVTSCVRADIKWYGEGRSSVMASSAATSAASSMAFPNELFLEILRHALQSDHVAFAQTCSTLTKLAYHLGQG